MATYKGRDVQILHEVTSPADHKVMVRLEDGDEKRVSKGEVTIFSADEVPVEATAVDGKKQTEEEARTAFYHKATPTDVKRRDQRKATADRLAQYQKDGLTPAEVQVKETEWHAANPEVDVKHTPKVSK